MLALGKTAMKKPRTKMILQNTIAIESSLWASGLLLKFDKI